MPTNPYAAARRRAEDLAAAAVKPSPMVDLMSQPRAPAPPMGSMAAKNVEARGNPMLRGFVVAEVERVAALLAAADERAPTTLGAATAYQSEVSWWTEFGDRLRVTLQSLGIEPAIGDIDVGLLTQPLNGLPLDVKRLPAALAAMKARVFGMPLEDLRAAATQWEQFMDAERQRSEALEPVGLNGLPPREPVRT